MTDSFDGLLKISPYPLIRQRYMRPLTPKATLKREAHGFIARGAVVISADQDRNAIAML